MNDNDAFWQEWNGEICAGCDMPSLVNDVGLCPDCSDKLERDLIRSRDWDYSGVAFAVPDEKLEDLRLRIMREYGKDYELIEAPSNDKLRANKASKHLPIIEEQLPQIDPRTSGTYTDSDVIDVIEQILRASEHNIWRELHEVSLVLRRYFPDLTPKALGYKNLSRMMQAHPQRIETMWDNPKKKGNRSLYIRLLASKR